MKRKSPNGPNKKGLLQNSLTKKLRKKSVPEKSKTASLEGRFSLPFLNFLCRLPLRFYFRTTAFACRPVFDLKLAFAALRIWRAKAFKNSRQEEISCQCLRRLISCFLKIRTPRAASQSVPRRFAPGARSTHDASSGWGTAPRRPRRAVSRGGVTGRR